MLPKQLEDIFEEYTEDDYYIFLTRVDHSTETLFLDIELQFQDINAKGEILQRWTIEVKSHRKSRATFGHCRSLELLNDDARLWEFTDLQGELYFNGQMKDPTRLFYDLYVTHKDLFSDTSDFSLSFGADLANFGQYQFTNGLIAKGARKVLQQYATCLEKHELGFSIIGSRKPTYWDGEKHIPERNDLKILYLGDTFFIAEEFLFKQTL